MSLREPSFACPRPQCFKGGRGKAEGLIDLDLGQGLCALVGRASVGPLAHGAKTLSSEVGSLRFSRPDRFDNFGQVVWDVRFLQECLRKVN